MTDPRCGTLAGNSAHRRRGEKPCDPCRLAKNARNTYLRRRARETGTPVNTEEDRALMPNEPPRSFERRLAEHDPAWKRQAACKGMDQTVFFPARGWRQSDRAKQICAGCPVRQECLEFAVDTRQEGGIWGGTSFKERQAIRNAQS